MLNPASGMTPHSSVLGARKAVDILAVGAAIGGGGELQGALSVLQVDHVLDAPLAEGPLADDRRAMMVLEAGSDDLAGAGLSRLTSTTMGKPSKAPSLRASKLARARCGLGC